MEKKISFVIPVYNNADGIKKCVDSIICEEMNSIEIIIIDDGSTDDTTRVLKEIAAERPDVRCLSQDHKGVVEARLLGLSAAKGSYIWFVDSDDRLCKNAVNGVLNDLSIYSYPDMVVYNHFIEGDGKKTLMKSTLKAGRYDRKKIESEIFPFAFHDFRQKHFRQPVLDGFLWNKIWKKELIEKALCKDKKISLFEDAVSVFMAVSFAGSIYKSDNPVYIYVKGESSTSGYRNDYFYNTALCAKLLSEEVKKLPSKLIKDGIKGANAFITERLIVSIVREMRFKKKIFAAYGNVASELRKYRIHRKVRFTGLPFFIKLYLFLLKSHLYVTALMIAKVMS